MAILYIYIYIYLYLGLVQEKIAKDDLVRGTMGSKKWNRIFNVFSSKKKKKKKKNSNYTDALKV